MYLYGIYMFMWVSSHRFMCVCVCCVVGGWERWRGGVVSVAGSCGVMPTYTRSFDGGCRTYLVGGAAAVGAEHDDIGGVVVELLGRVVLLGSGTHLSGWRAPDGLN